MLLTLENSDLLLLYANPMWESQFSHSIDHFKMRNCVIWGSSLILDQWVGNHVVAPIGRHWAWQMYGAALHSWVLNSRSRVRFLLWKTSLKADRGFWSRNLDGYSFSLFLSHSCFPIHLLPSFLSLPFFLLPPNLPFPPSASSVLLACQLNKIQRWLIVIH